MKTENIFCFVVSGDARAACRRCGANDFQCARGAAGGDATGGCLLRLGFRQQYAYRLCAGVHQWRGQLHAAGHEFYGAVGGGIAPGTNQKITWNAGQDWPTNFSTNVRFRVTADDQVAPSGMALIPAGSFTMGNCMNSSEGNSNELPLHTVYVSAFYMDKYDVTKSLWDSVYQWATNHGYSFDYAGSGKAANHPVQTIDWYDAVKWCNARSEKEGRYRRITRLRRRRWCNRSGQTNVQNDWVKWSSGYRLPTEAEWEKAARGGASGQRFPWGNTISESQANYYSSGTSYYTYDFEQHWL